AASPPMAGAPAAPAAATPAASIAVARPRSADSAETTRRTASPVAVDVGVVGRAHLAAPAAVRALRMSRAAETGARPGRTARADVATTPSKPVRSPSEQEPRSTPARRTGLGMPGAASGPNGETATAGPRKRTLHGTAWLWLAALLPAGAAIAVVRRRRRVSGSPEPA